MRSKLLATVSATAIILGAAASEQARAADLTDPILSDAWYVTLFGGGAFGFGHSNVDNDIQEIDLKDGFTVGGAIGTQIAPGLRFEGEISYVRNENDRTREDVNDPFDNLPGHTDIVYFLANLWKDVDLGPVSIYAGGGLGPALLHVSGNPNVGSVSWSDEAKLALGGQLGAGFRFGLTDRVSLDAGYRFKAAVDVGYLSENGDENSDATIYEHIVQLGVTYGFGSYVDPAGAFNPGASDWYVTLFAGASFPQDTTIDYSTIYSVDNKTGFTVGGALGTHVAPDLRAELEVSYQRHALQSYSDSKDNNADADGHQDQLFVLANLWKDIHLGMFSPYVGAGIGFGLIDFDGATLNGDEFSDRTGVGFAGQIGAGVRVAVTDNIAADVGYRFKAMTEAFVGGDEDDDSGNHTATTYSHVLQAGLTYNFGGPVIQPAAAPASGNWYVSVFGGGVFPVDNHVAYTSSNYYVDYKTGFTLGATVGTELLPTVRGELEVSYVEYDADTADEQGGVENVPGGVDAVFVLANVWKDFHIGSFSPYVGIGVGLAVVDVEMDLDGPGNAQIDDTTVALGAQAGAGVRVPVTDNISVDVGYRFKAAAGVFTEGANAGDGHGFASYYSHIVQGGIAWNF